MEAILTWIFTNLGIAAVVGFILLYLIATRISVLQEMYNRLVTKFKIKDGYLPSKMLKYKLTYWRDFKIDTIKLNDPGRQAIFRDLLHIKFRIFSNNIFQLKNVDKYSEDELLEQIYECFKDMNEQFGIQTTVIPEIVVNKFIEWNKPTVNFVMLNVESICRSPIYNSNRERLEAIYALYTVMLETTILEAERSLNELNGELSGVEYKGIVCQ